MNFIVDIANMIFDQEWTVEPDWEENDQETCDEKLVENENTTQFEKLDEVENSQNHGKQIINHDHNKEKDPKRKRLDNDGNQKKKRNVQEDLTYKMPSI